MTIAWNKDYEAPEFIYDNVRIGLQKHSLEAGRFIRQATEFEGIEQYMFVMIPDSEGRMASFKLKDWMLDRCELDEAYLWKRAAENTRRAFMVMKMSEALGVSGPDFPLIVTNKIKYKGAASILFARGVLDPGKYFALPSSIHEFLLAPDEGQSIDDMSDMVRAINQAEVLPEERLSDLAYRFEVK